MPATDMPGSVWSSLSAKRVAVSYVAARLTEDRKSTRLNSSHTVISYAVFCLKKKKRQRSAPFEMDFFFDASRKDRNLFFRGSPSDQASWSRRVRRKPCARPCTSA